MPRPVPPHRTEAWTVFGRWRRPSPLGRALGVALLLLSLALTVWWASSERGVPDPSTAGGPGARVAQPTAAVGSTDAARSTPFRSSDHDPKPVKLRWD